MDLRARALELERQLQESSQSIRTTTTNLKRKRARAQRQGEKSSQRARVLATYWLAGNSLDLAVECWAKLRTHLHCEGEETYAAKGRRCVQKWVQEVPAEEKDGSPTRQLACIAQGIEACVRFHCRRPRSYVGIEKQYRERICAHHISVLGRTSKTTGTATRPRG